MADVMRKKIACRDFSIGLCDWYYISDDELDLLVTIIEHDINVHKWQWRGILKDIKKGKKNTVSTSIYRTLQLMRDTR
jgi:hypothetical protein